MKDSRKPTVKPVKVPESYSADLVEPNVDEAKEYVVFDRDPCLLK